jgi:hypothetical protein
VAVPASGGFHEYHRAVVVAQINEVDGDTRGKQSLYFTRLDTLPVPALWITATYRSPLRGTIRRCKILWREHRNYSLASLDCFIHFNPGVLLPLP